MIKYAHHIRMFLVGGAMGVANIIPGVSGGTLAVVFGIYEQLMEALSNFASDKERRKEYIVFLSTVFGGALFSIVAFARLLSWAFDNYELMTVYFFLGLIIGSIPVVIKAHDDMKIKISRLVSFVIGVALVVIFSLMQKDSGIESQVFNPQSFGLTHYLYYIFSGALAASAMIIPGLSGSFILILLGIYRVVLDSVSYITKINSEIIFSEEFNVRLYILFSLVIGVIAGILGFSRFMNWALKHYAAVTMYAILGLIVGSLYQIFPGFEFSLNGLGAVVTFVVGGIISLRFGRE
jgi:putative membrane protein